MKKAAIFIVMICYFAVSSGVIVNFHYCMNKLASTGLFAAQGKRCGQCGMDMHKQKGCCRDEVKLVKMENDQQVTTALSFEMSSLDAVYQLPSKFIATSFINSTSGQKYFQNHSPPLLTEQDTYLENRVFRI